MVGTFADAFAAINAAFLNDHRFAVADPDRLDWTTFNAICTALAFLGIEGHGVKILFHVSSPAFF
jgi:hypothetical protein